MPERDVGEIVREQRRRQRVLVAAEDAPLRQRRQLSADQIRMPGREQRLAGPALRARGGEGFGVDGLDAGGQRVFGLGARRQVGRAQEGLPGLDGAGLDVAGLDGAGLDEAGLDNG